MTNHRFNEIDIPDQIDTVIDNGIKRALKKKKTRKVWISTFTSIGILFILGISNPAAAAKIPVIGGVFALIEESLEQSGEYSKYATSINETVTSNGISITLSDVLSDGQSLYVSYRVESSEPFKYTTRKKSLDVKQLLAEADYHVDFTSKKLSNAGIAGLEGSFLDDRTFVGMTKYHLDSLGMEIPKQFEFTIEYSHIGTFAIDSKDKDQIFLGSWSFKVPVRVDQSLKKVVKPDNIQNDNGYKVEAISVTPFELMVKTTPDKTDTKIRIYDDQNRKVPFKLSMREGTSRIHLFEALPIDCRSIRIVLYKDDLEEIFKIDEEGKTQIFFNHNVLLDQVISIKN